MVLGTLPSLESVSEIKAVWDTAPENYNWLQTPHKCGNKETEQREWGNEGNRARGEHSISTTQHSELSEGGKPSCRGSCSAQEALHLDTPQPSACPVPAVHRLQPSLSAHVCYVYTRIYSTK